MQGAQRYIIFSFLAGSVLLWITLSKLLAAVMFAVGATDTALLGSEFTITTAVGLVVAGVAGFVTYKNEKVYNYTSEVIAELKKVTWPSKKEVQSATIVVIITTLIIGVMLFLFDSVWGELTGLIYTS